MSETFVRQFYPDAKTLDSHHLAIVAQARNADRGIVLARSNHERLKNIEAAVDRIEINQADQKLYLTKKEQSSAVVRTAIEAGKAVLVTLVTLAGAYLMQPAEKPEVRPLAPETLEAMRLYRQRTGHELGQRPPGGGEPEPFSAPKTAAP